MNPFETETMADLHARQGHLDEALAIYRRLRDRTADQEARERLDRRIAALEAGNDSAAGDADPAPAEEPALPEPGVRARWSGGQVTIEWRLPPETPAPAVEVLLVKTGAAGVATETRTLEVDANRGRVVLGVKDLHSVRVAAGRRGEAGFVPLVRG